MTKKEIKTLDALWSKLVKLKAKGRCEKCGINDKLNSHHIYSRNNYSVRWDTDNGACLCSGDHSMRNTSAHKAPADFIEFMKEKRGEVWFNKLRIASGITQKHDYKLLKLYLESEIKRCG